MLNPYDYVLKIPGFVLWRFFLKGWYCCENMNLPITKKPTACRPPDITGILFDVKSYSCFAIFITLYIHIIWHQDIRMTWKNVRSSCVLFFISISSCLINFIIQKFLQQVYPGATHKHLLFIYLILYEHVNCFKLNSIKKKRGKVLIVKFYFEFRIKSVCRFSSCHLSIFM